MKTRAAIVTCLLVSLTPATASARVLEDDKISAALGDAIDEADDATAMGKEAAADPAAAKFWEAIKLLESRQKTALAAGRAALQEASDLEFVHAQVLLGNCYLSASYGFPKDVRRAINLFRLAAERGNAFAKVSLGSCYATGTGVRRDPAKAAEWLESALLENADFSRPAPPPDFFKDSDRPGADVAGELANDPVAGSKASAHFLLGQIKARENKLEEAQRHYVAAAFAGIDGRSGVYQAAVEAAVNYAFGRGTPRDSAKANELLEQSRRLNARYGVSLIHNYAALKIVDEFAVADLEEQIEEEGTGRQSALQVQIARGLADKKSKDYNAAEAARWYELAANSGQVWGMLSLAFLHADGDLGKPDPVQAYHWFEKAATAKKDKHALGIANLGICLQQGYGTPKDEVRAAALFRKHSRDEIVSYLATIGQAPTKIVTYEEHLRLIEHWAREKNDPHAQYLLGRRYFAGEGFKQSLSDALRWFRKAAKARNPEALLQLGILYHFHWPKLGISNPQEAFKTAAENYRLAGEQGQVEALANYAYCLANGFGVPQDEEAAIRTYERCLELEPNHSRANSNLGQIYNQKLLKAGNAVGAADWREKMIAHYEASFRQEGSYSCILLGDLYHQGRLVKQDYDKAYRCYEQGTTEPAHRRAAHHRLGGMHEKGEGVPVTPAEAAYHYRLAALEGEILSLRRLVNFYITGTGVSRDFDRAMYWLGHMIRLGQIDALPVVGDVLMQQGEHERARRLFQLLVDDRNSKISGHAHERLSHIYNFGLGAKKNPKRAARHFQRAVELGDGNALTTLARRQMAEGKIPEGLATFERAARNSATAAFNLGQMYFFGTYVAADRPKALKYLWDAAKNNNADAQYFLAGLTYNREPDGPTLDQAINLAIQAETLGNAKATTLREKLELRRKSDAKPEDDSRRARAS